MSSDDSSLLNLQDRLSAIEVALGLPHSSSSVPSSLAVQELQTKVASLEKQLVKSEYRISHLVAAYDRHVEEIASLRAQLASHK